MTSADTIFAPASGPGRSAVAVVRISGRDSGPALSALVGGALPPPRRAVVRRLVRPGTGEAIDQALVLWLPAPGSFTGEDVAEVHCHGGLAVRAAILGALSGMNGLRAAEPGEFTRRAFLNGRMDLSEVEGLSDLIEAETEAQRRQALRQMDGALSRPVMNWRERLLDAAALLESYLDFADEEDIPSSVDRAGFDELTAVRAEVEAALAGAVRGERLRDGFAVVIAGPPNAGKSTLLNAFAQRDVAIVSPHAGTTRDAIEVRCDLGGLPVLFIDTAGWRDTEDPVERVGIERARERAASADLVLWLDPGDAADRAFPPERMPILRVRTKVDVAGNGPSDHDAAVSAVTGSGMETLIALVQGHAHDSMGGGDALVTRERHRAALSSVAECLARAQEVYSAGQVELAAEDVRLALRALGRISGQVDVDEVLDRIFSRFCIGK